MNLYGQKKKSTAFKFVALLNVATFIIFRLTVSFYLFYWWFTTALGAVVWHLATVSPPILQQIHTYPESQYSTS